MKKLDLLKADANYYKVGKKPEIRDLDTYYYLSVSGKCAPEDQEFLVAIEALYKVAYTIKFMLKENELDFVVPKMEGFWWVDGGAENQENFNKIPRSEWNWKILIRLPDFVEEEHFTRAKYVAEEKKADFEAIKQVNYEKINEGKCAQILHVGSYEEEKASLDVLYEFIEANGYKINNYHHEIYLSDPRRTAPEKLRTILRYGIE
ncbi:MAG: GyrI-like domain-containing protein [Bacteroidota bacterium]